MIFKCKKPKTWTTPGGVTSELYMNMLQQPHLLIAGATGSGKSVVINGIMYNALYSPPGTVNFILIDPKRVELSTYKQLPHTLIYSSEPDQMIAALNAAMYICEERYKTMQKQGVKKYTGGDLYVIIDELADLMTTQRKTAQPIIQRLCQIGRAAKIHVIAATQCPLAAVIPTPIKVNFDARVGLRTRSAQDSRNILGIKGLEDLPRFGRGVYMTPEQQQLYIIPYIEDTELQQRVNWWMNQI